MTGRGRGRDLIRRGNSSLPSDLFPGQLVLRHTVSTESEAAAAAKTFYFYTFFFLRRACERGDRAREGRDGDATEGIGLGGPRSALSLFLALPLPLPLPRAQAFEHVVTARARALSLFLSLPLTLSRSAGLETFAAGWIISHSNIADMVHTAQSI